MADEDTKLVRAGCWQWLRGTGLERFELRSCSGGWILRGSIVAVEADGPVEARYRVACDDAWRTRRAEVTVRGELGERRILVAGADGCWTVDGRDAQALSGCLDVDLEWSPSTNTLPLRRLPLGPANPAASVDAAWIRFPALTVERLHQEYTHVAPGRVRYALASGSFSAELSVDDEGLVIDYGDLWRRL